MAKPFYIPIAIFALFSAAVAEQEIHQLEPGQVVEREIAGYQSQT